MSKIFLQNEEEANDARISLKLCKFSADVSLKYLKNFKCICPFIKPLCFWTPRRLLLWPIRITHGSEYFDAGIAQNKR